MKLWVGTSGYSFKEWKGNFYPEKLPAKDMLRYYGERLSAVEINNTFYRLPKVSVLESWAEQVGEGFRFSIKASRRITHIKRLKDAADETEYLFRTVDTLGERLGVLLFQLPPNLKKDLDRLEPFLDLFPAGARAAFEFRHESWFDDDVLEALRDRGYALCLADTDEEDLPAELVETAPWGYLRLRKAEYSEADLTAWCKRLKGTSWEQIYLFFKHEDEGLGPKLAAQFEELWETP